MNHMCLMCLYKDQKRANTVRPYGGSRINRRPIFKANPAITTQITGIRTADQRRKPAAIFYYEAQRSNKAKPAITTQTKDTHTANPCRKSPAIFLLRSKASNKAKPAITTRITGVHIADQRRKLAAIFYNSNIFFNVFAVFPTVRATISSPSISAVLPRGIVIKESRIR